MPDQKKEKNSAKGSLVGFLGESFYRKSKHGELPVGNFKPIIDIEPDSSQNTGQSSGEGQKKDG